MRLTSAIAGQLIRIIMAWACLPGLADAFTATRTVTDLGSGRVASYSAVMGELRLLKSGVRQDSPQAQETVQGFLRKRFEDAGITPDEVSYVQASGAVALTVRSPYPMTRRMGTGSASSNLFISFTPPQELMRPLLTDREGIKVRILFHLNMQDEIIVDHLDVSYRGRELYRE